MKGITGKSKAHERLVIECVSRIKTLNIREPCLILVEGNYELDEHTKELLRYSLTESGKQLKLNKCAFLITDHRIESIKTTSIEEIQELIDSLEEAKEELSEFLE